MRLLRKRETPQKRGTAEQFLSPGQMVVAFLLLALCAAELYWYGTVAFLRTVIGLVTVFYMLFVGMKLFMWMSANGYVPYARLNLPSTYDPALPKYTILVPLLKEPQVVARLVKALCRLEYPTDKLDIKLLLEERDNETRKAVNGIALPDHIRAVIVPDIGPRTKPKACNYGYMEAEGARVVIYDAEDRPERDQLLKAVAAFQQAAHKDRRIACLQGILMFWNPRSSWVGPFCWAEYVVHFRWMLTGLARRKLIPPLGGTSNHFLRDALDEISRQNGDWVFLDADGGQPVTIQGPWDPYNVTEDADLAMRLAKAGYRTDILPSVTYEEAPEHARRAKNQRSRWLQGYAQTGLVHLRRPFRAMRRVGVMPYLCFELLMLGTPLALLLNPLTWATTILYIVSRLAPLPAVTLYMEELFISPVYYAGMLVALAGNMLLFYQSLSAVVREQEWAEERVDGTGHELGDYLSREQYGLTLWLLLKPLWWAFTSIAAYKGVYRLLVPSLRSFWDKSDHGHDQGLERQLELASGAVPSSAVHPSQGVEND